MAKRNLAMGVEDGLSATDIMELSWMDYQADVGRPDDLPGVMFRREGGEWTAPPGSPGGWSSARLAHDGNYASPNALSIRKSAASLGGTPWLIFHEFMAWNLAAI